MNHIFLQAAVFKVVNQDENQPTKPASGKAGHILASSEGALAADLVREFLEFYDLQNSLAVLVPEASLDESFPGILWCSGARIRIFLG